MTTIIFLSFFWTYWESNSSLPLHHQVRREKRARWMMGGHGTSCCMVHVRDLCEHRSLQGDVSAFPQSKGVPCSTLLWCLQVNLLLIFFFFLWKCLELANDWKYSLSIWVCSFQMACGVWRVGFCEKIIMRNWAGHWFRIGMQAGALLLSKLSPFCLSQGWWNDLKKYNLRHFKDGKCSQLTFQPLIMTRL